MKVAALTKRWLSCSLVLVAAAAYAGGCGESSGRSGSDFDGGGGEGGGDPGADGSSRADTGNPTFGSGDGSFLDGTSSFDGAACAASVQAAKRAPANLLFIVDRSGSMSCNPPPTQTSANCEQFPRPQNPAAPTKWTITRDALKNAVAALSGSPTSVGLTYFSNGAQADSCGVQSAPNVPLAPVDAALIGAVGASLTGVVPQGLTPVVGGVTLGYQHLHESPAGKALVGKKFVVLITDGFETCAPQLVPNFINQIVVDASRVGIRTFVVGAPGSEEGRAVLSQIAYNGGTARTATCTHTASPANVGDCHLDLTNPSLDFAVELPKVLDAISREALGCEFDVPKGDGGTIDYDQVNVSFKPSGAAQEQPVLQDPSKPCEGGASGWQYTPDRSRILLCGPACQAVKNDPGGQVAITLGCKTQVR